MQNLDQTAFLHSLDSLKIHEPLVAEVFFLENHQIHFPLAKLLFMSKDRSESLLPQTLPTSLIKKIQIAQQHEFRQKCYQKAFTSYQESFSQTTNQKIKGEMLNAIARVQKKSTRFRAAIISYEKITKQYGQIKIADGIPLGLAAQLELGSLSLALHDSSIALRTFMDLYEDLMLNTEHLITGLLNPALERYASPADLSWIVKGRDGETILTSQKPPNGQMTVRTNFAGNFPFWSLEFNQRDPDLFELLLTSRRILYLSIFFLLAGMLIFGLTFTIRSVTHELALAKMKSDFVSTISHEFRSPITAIRQFAEILMTNRVPSEKRRQQYL